MEDLNSPYATEPNFARIFGAVLTGGFLSAFFAMPATILLQYLGGNIWTSIVHGAELRSTGSEPSFYIWVSTSTISLIFILPVCLGIALPMLVYLRNLKRVYMIIISCVMASLSVGIIICLLSGKLIPKALLSGISYCLIFGIVVAWFRGPGKVGRFSIEKAD